MIHKYFERIGCKCEKTCFYIKSKQIHPLQLYCFNRKINQYHTTDNLDFTYNRNAPLKQRGCFASELLKAPYNYMINASSCAGLAFSPLAKGTGVQLKKKINLECIKFKTTEYPLETFQRSNQDTSQTHKPVVFEGHWVQSGDLLTDCASSVGGELALGQNILIAYMPWEGYNFEDAILISERLVVDDLYTSVHIERYDIETYVTKLGSEEITQDIPDITEREKQNLDSFGIIKLGSWVEENDILVGKITPIEKKNITPYQKLLYTILKKRIRPIRDSSLRAPKGIKAKVINIKYFLRQITSLRSILNKTKKLKLKENVSSRFVSSSFASPRKKDVYSTLQNRESSYLHKATPFFRRQVSHLPSTGEMEPRTGALLLARSPCFFLASPCFAQGKGTKRFLSPSSLSFPVSCSLLRTGSKGVRRRSKDGKQGREAYFVREAKQPLCLLRTAREAKKQEAKQPFLIKSRPKLRGLARSERQIHANILKQKKLISIESIHIYLAEKRKIQVGDKMAGRHGNKGIVSKILPIQDMPFLPDGTPIDMVLNPLGVPSRMNVGQIYECLLGLAGNYLGENYKVSSFDEIYGPEASRSFVFSKLFQASQQTGNKWLFNPFFPGKIRIFDGRTGETFEQLVTVGQAYMLRLVHMVDDKIHMRSTGPYSLVTQQPLRGRSKQGGQRLGEMEVWALEGFGAAFILLEMLTIKSDDMTGRMTLWSNFILNKDILIGTPESFKVLICELQSLCLDIGLFRYSGQKTLNTPVGLLKGIDGRLLAAGPALGSSFSSRSASVGRSARLSSKDAKQRKNEDQPPLRSLASHGEVKHKQQFGVDYSTIETGESDNVAFSQLTETKGSLKQVLCTPFKNKGLIYKNKKPMDTKQNLKEIKNLMNLP